MDVLIYSCPDPKALKLILSEKGAPYVHGTGTWNLQGNYEKKHSSNTISFQHSSKQFIT